MTKEYSSGLAIRRYTTKERAYALLEDINRNNTTEFVNPLRTQVVKIETGRDLENNPKYEYEVYVTLR
ncbi:MAG: hypothetical protein Q7S33_00445 [Nanoarchaeota archaeon]|nr:hypothetical protein [Nanoarchaeota archaeon]